MITKKKIWCDDNNNGKNRSAMPRNDTALALHGSCLSFLLGFKT